MISAGMWAVGTSLLFYNRDILKETDKIWRKLQDMWDT